MAWWTCRGSIPPRVGRQPHREPVGQGCALRLQTRAGVSAHGDQGAIREGDGGQRERRLVHPRPRDDAATRRQVPPRHQGSPAAGLQQAGARGGHRTRARRQFKPHGAPYAYSCSKGAQDRARGGARFTVAGHIRDGEGPADQPRRLLAHPAQGADRGGGASHQEWAGAG